ncbi:MAG: hypothetical protein KC620_16525, partial [Myxococcales bacterium]|nr:hypothetical protein [Myxococcales bacterium]
MFGLRTAFFNGLSGLRVSQAALATVSHNIANADTEGYSRQRVEIAARNALRLGGTAGLGYGGQGAYIQQVSRADENFLELQVLRDRTLKGFFGGREETLSIVERLYTEGGTPTLSDAFDNFFNAARELSQDPSSFGSRGAFMASVEDVASTFRTMANDLQVAQRGIDDSLGGRL